MMSKVAVLTGERDELLTDPVFAGIDGADCGLHDIGDGLKGEFIADMQTKKLLIGGREMLDERRKGVSLLLTQEAVRGCRFAVNKLVADNTRRLRIGVEADGGALMTEEVDRVVVGDDLEPVAQLAAAGVLGEFPKVIANQTGKQIGLEIEEIVLTGTMTVNAQRVPDGEEHSRLITLKQLHPPSAVSSDTGAHEAPVVVVTGRDVFRDKSLFVVLFSHNVHPKADPRLR